MHNAAEKIVLRMRILVFIDIDPGFHSSFQLFITYVNNLATPLIPGLLCT